MKILKFGGTSVGSAGRMKNLVPLIVNEETKIVVLSAMSGTTNNLVEISNALSMGDLDKANGLITALEHKYEDVLKDLYTKESALAKGKELIKKHFAFMRSLVLDNFTPKKEKIILAEGEMLSTALVHYYLEEIGVSSVLLPALDFMRIDDREEPDLSYIEEHLKAELRKYPKDNLFITQGYICRNAAGDIDNLKRGGSDYTATIIGAALTAEEIQIWTDIDGMHNNDPRIVDKTYPVTELSFDEAAELAYFGAKILHPTCVLPAQKRNIPVRLLNTMQPEAKGTVISNKKIANRITAVAAKDGITSIRIKSTRMLLAYGFLRSVFEVFERYKTSIDMITTSEVAVSLTIDDTKNLDAIIKELEKYCSVEVNKDQTIICVVGNFALDKTGYALKILEALKDIPISMISYGGSENNITVLVHTAEKKKALMSLNTGLFFKPVLQN